MRRRLLRVIALVIGAGLLASVYWLSQQEVPTVAQLPGTPSLRPTVAGSDRALGEDDSSTALQARRVTGTPTAPPTGIPGMAATIPTPTPEESKLPAAFWLAEEELAALPSLPDAIQNWAERETQVRIGDQNNQGDAAAVAAAYACIYAGERRFCDRVRALIREAANTDVWGMKTLSLNRNLAGYAVAASLLGEYDPAFAAWLQEAIHTRTWTAWTDDWTVYRSAMQEPSNGGCHARASVTAIALYTGDAALLDEVANRFHDWLGRSADGWLWDEKESWWQSASNPDEFNGVNPAGATLLIDGVPRNVDGVLPEDMKRSGRPEYPFPIEEYVRECQQGMVATAWMLHQAGYPAFEWEDQAVLRSFRWFVEEAGGEYRGDDAGLPYLIRAVYGVDYVTEPARPGKNGLGFYDWTHGEGQTAASGSPSSETDG